MFKVQLIGKYKEKIMHEFKLPEDFDLQDSMQSLYKTGDYFFRLKYRAEDAFEESYHSLVCDPDGRVRDLTSDAEKQHKLVNFQGEILAALSKFPQSRLKIMDIGCGPGWLLSALGDHWEKYGVEISKFAAQIAQEHGVIHNVSIEEYENPVNEFDVVVLHHVIEHLNDPVAAITKIHAMLRPDGLLVLGTPDFDSGAARRYGNNYRLLHDQTHISLFSSDSMHRFLRDNGFKIERVEYPFFETAFFSKQSLSKLLEPDIVSPPFYGNVMTFFAKKI